VRAIDAVGLRNDWLQITDWLDEAEKDLDDLETRHTDGLPAALRMSKRVLRSSIQPDLQSTLPDQQATGFMSIATRAPEHAVRMSQQQTSPVVRVGLVHFHTGGHGRPARGATACRCR